MARYRASVVSTVLTAAAYQFVLLAPSTGDFLLRRMTIGFTSSGGVPNSQQVNVNVGVVTGATAVIGAITPGLLRSTSRPALATCGTGTPTGTLVNSPSPFVVTLNSQSAADLPWEQLEEWQVPANSAIAVQNTVALPASSGITVSAEWEE